MEATTTRPGMYRGWTECRAAPVQQYGGIRVCYCRRGPAAFRIAPRHHSRIPHVCMDVSGLLWQWKEKHGGPPHLLRTRDFTGPARGRSAE